MLTNEHLLLQVVGEQEQLHYNSVIFLTKTVCFVLYRLGLLGSSY